ncbi:MAG TPA: hypothetical protein DDW51_05580 [Cyanobacteria bacterium UBA11367]|nr:hypothetical protein [Cyanobacteria bacterium UBA11367]HBE56755.1 hypothetical protein [Cyanobacteria bacterium UBA11366]
MDISTIEGKKMKGIVYDCEIINCIPSAKMWQKPQLTYCKGWDDFEGMGISVICASEIDSDQKWEFSFYNIQKFQAVIYKALRENYIIAGFNSKSFDDNLCRANGIAITTNFDLLEEIRIAAFNSPRWEDTPKGRTYKLDAIAKANGMSKTGSGELAPELWQMGKEAEVMQYCMNDVLITKQLLIKFINNQLVDPNTNLVLQYKGT